MSEFAPNRATHRQRIEALELLRVAAALVVVLGHLHMHGFLGTAPDLPWYLKWIGLGHLSVLIFFGLSGYVLVVGGAFDTEASSWLRRRLKRLLPLYYIALVLPALADVAMSGSIRFRAEFGSSALMLSALVPRFDFDGRNAPLWSLQVEVWLSVVLCVWAAAMRQRPRLRVASSVGSLTIALALALGTSSIGIATLEGLPFFIAGVMLALSATALRGGHASAALGALAIVAWLGAPWYLGSASATARLLAGLPFVSLALWAASGVTMPAPFSRPALALGRRTYALYAVHWPVLLALKTMWPGTGIMRSVSAGVAVAIATELTYRWIDAPAIRWARGTVSRRAGVAPTGAYADHTKE